MELNTDFFQRLLNQCSPLKFIVSQMFRIYLIILNIEKQLGNAVKRRQAFNQRFLKD